MDLLDLAAETSDGAIMQVYHPKTGKPVEGMTVTVRALQNEDVQSIFRKHRQRAALRVGRDGKPLELTEAETQRNSVEIYDALIQSWTGMSMGKESLLCDSESKKMIVTDERKRWDWLLGDVIAFASEIANFFRADDASGDVAEASRVATHKARKGDTDAS